MDVVRERAALAASLAALRADGRRIALVPTMGNLHEGHLSLIRHARSVADAVVATIFVNPLQFDDPRDLAAYPRTLDADIRKLVSVSTDLLFCPDTTTMYPRGLAASARVVVPGLSDMLEGAHRPGHFEGVATVVALIFNLIRPQVAVFGEKDYQQLMIIRRMVDDLAFGIDIHGRPTLREADGLAMSSRNARLSEEERRIAPALQKVLQQTVDRLNKGEVDYTRIETDAAGELSTAGLQPDYVTIRKPLDLGTPESGCHSLRILAAARLGAVRLIDNVGFNC